MRSIHLVLLGIMLVSLVYAVAADSPNPGFEASDLIIAHAETIDDPNDPCRMTLGSADDRTFEGGEWMYIYYDIENTSDEKYCVKVVASQQGLSSASESFGIINLGGPEYRPIDSHETIEFPYDGTNNTPSHCHMVTTGERKATPEGVSFEPGTYQFTAWVDSYTEWNSSGCDESTKTEMRKG
ncbi:hypothetical protein KJ891_05200, partial [Candidatus Micrarchaeota archaeon]|nr:hypothetical protein [Candidatus Micrarchaeota archaeon]